MKYLEKTNVLILFSTEERERVAWMSGRLYIVSDDLLILAQFVHDCVKADRLLVVTTTANLFSLGNCHGPHKARTWYLFVYGGSHAHRPDSRR